MPQRLEHRPAAVHDAGWRAACAPSWPARPARLRRARTRARRAGSTTRRESRARRLRPRAARVRPPSGCARSAATRAGRTARPRRSRPPRTSQRVPRTSMRLGPLARRPAPVRAVVAHGSRTAPSWRTAWQPVGRALRARARRRRRRPAPRHPAASGARPPPPRATAAAPRGPARRARSPSPPLPRPRRRPGPSCRASAGLHTPALVLTCNPRAGRPAAGDWASMDEDAMCARFQFAPPEDWVEEFGLSDVPETPARYNIAPTQDVLAVRRRHTGARQARLFRWGLVPRWAEDPKVGNRLINARAESVSTRAGLPRLLPPAPLPRARAGVLRMEALRPRARAVAHPAEGGADVRVRRTVGPLGRRRRRDRVLRAPHHRRQPAGRADPRPHAGAARSATRYAAWLDPDATEADLRPLLEPFPGGRDGGLRGLDAREQHRRRRRRSRHAGHAGARSRPEAASSEPSRAAV